MVCNSADVDALRSAVASLGIPHIHVKQDCSPLRLSRNARNAVAAAYEYLQIGAVVVSPYLLTSLKCLDDHGGNAVVAGSVMATWAASLVAGSMVPTRTSSPRLVLIAATAPLGLTALVNQRHQSKIMMESSILLDATTTTKRYAFKTKVSALAAVVATCMVVSFVVVHKVYLPALATTTGNVVASSYARVPALADPETSAVAFSFLAIGDWGGTLGKTKGIPGTCCKLSHRLDESPFKVDSFAQEYVAALLAIHGDNFYWSGVGTADVQYRLEQSFENVYSAPSLRAIPWLNVAGNHDLGGNSFICGDADGHFRECSVDELVEFLDIRFQAQAKYTSPHHNRWVLRDHYYVERVARDGVSVDIFNLDTNHAVQHGVQDVCCQCFGYEAKFGLNQTEVCDDVMAGDLGCAGGNREMLDACVDKIEAWAKDSYA
ncbi:hypothetical protein H257_05227 [Aphanomyces astaci]|uniref:Calcineurin-like phosphoesterase domain-containing protein n=1 Tax=Aphanomyces astaci TaxID=112090 RepID=W4GSJ1_APHAT|nr:hypothetical protein H257_05227 [Aphanomyces astaci]ETV82657.1 hypothetical protein H257_05227 [Aphanomyces astaci]|eukprot:XP_009828326.1 hypothetical protein H257_05227 [Aphanomyces astaci]